MIVLFQFFNHFLCRFASRFYQNIYCGKNTNYPLTTKQNDRFASCANIVSRSQTSSLLSPPPPPHPWEDQYYRITCNYETIDLRHQYGIIVSEAQDLSWRNVPSGPRG